MQSKLKSPLTGLSLTHHYKCSLCLLTLKPRVGQNRDNCVYTHFSYYWVLLTVTGLSFSHICLSQAIQLHSSRLLHHSLSQFLSDTKWGVVVCDEQQTRILLVIWWTTCILPWYGLDGWLGSKNTLVFSPPTLKISQGLVISAFILFSPLLCVTKERGRHHCFWKTFQCHTHELVHHI